MLKQVSRWECESQMGSTYKLHEVDIGIVVMQNAQVQLRDAVLHQYSALQHELSSSEVVELPAGVPYMLRASAVLLKGTLKVSGRFYTEGRKGRAPPINPLLGTIIHILRSSTSRDSKCKGKTFTSIHMVDKQERLG